MGHAARRNPNAQAVADGKLLSRRTIVGAMDHALEMHANALRILEARIKAQGERIMKLELMHDIGTFKPSVEIPTGIVRAVVKTESAQPCGCDAGANWMCQHHRDELAGMVNANAD